jgi:hypothetical protein
MLLLLASSLIRGIHRTVRAQDDTKVNPKIIQLNSVKRQSERAVNPLSSFAFCVFGGLTAGPNAERGGREYAAASGGQDLQPNGQEQRRQVDAGRIPRRQQSRPANRSGLIPG